MLNAPLIILLLVQGCWSILYCIKRNLLFDDCWYVTDWDLVVQINGNGQYFMCWCEMWLEIDWIKLNPVVQFWRCGRFMMMMDDWYFAVWKNLNAWEMLCYNWLVLSQKRKLNLRKTSRVISLFHGTSTNKKFIVMLQFSNAIYKIKYFSNLKITRMILILFMCFNTNNNNKSKRADKKLYFIFSTTLECVLIEKII